MPIVEQTLDLKPKQEVSFSTTVHGSVRSGVFSILIIDFQGHVVGLDSGTFWYPENGERRRSNEELWDWATRKPPVPAPTEQDNLRIAATNLNAQRRELFRKKDLAGVAALNNGARRLWTMGPICLARQRAMGRDGHIEPDKPAPGRLRVPTNGSQLC